MKCQGWRLSYRFFPLFLFVLLSACGRGQSGWNAFPVPVYVDQQVMSSASARADFEEGMKFWEDRVGKKLFEVKGVWNGGELPYSGDAKNPDQIRENVVFVHRSWPFSMGFVGMTVVKPFDDGQRAMVMINPDTAFCNGDCNFDYSRTSLRKTFAHELGHFLGLGHVDSRADIMYPTSLPGGTLDHLTADENSLRAITRGAGG
jgi:hypothetical protein